MILITETVLRFELPLEAIDNVDSEAGSGSGTTSLFSCQHPRPSFIIYNNNAFFHDSTLLQNSTQQDVSPYIVSAKIGRASSVKLHRSFVEYTLAKPVSTK